MRRVIKVLIAAVVMAALMAVTAPSAFAISVPIPEEAVPGLGTAVVNGAPIGLAESLNCSPEGCVSSHYLEPPAPV